MFTTLSAMVVACAMLLPNASVFAATYSQELQDAYNWAYWKSITTMSSIDNANMYGAVTRAELAKMLANWAKDKGQTPDTSAACNFTDTASVQGDLATAIVEACQLGLMGQGITAFRPYDTISRAEFGTALSRALWGSQYEGGNPYYVNHLNALKAAGIMTQIANAESTKEVRGYVMLMLMRSEGSEGSSSTSDCDDPLVVIACAAESDACPAACREEENNNEEPGVVKAGSLVVTAEAAANRKILATGTSDLDTITFRTSEDVTISKVTLERYGYSDSDQVVEVRLEDQYGNVIADAKGLTKDKATLSIKKDYRTIDGRFEATVVVTTSWAAGTMWFKVTDVTSTAEDVDLDDYSPYTYDVVSYVGSNVTIEIKGTSKDYNYEEWDSYEVARLKVKAGDNAVAVKGFTLTNYNGLDVWEFLDEAVVTVDGTEVENLKYSVNKDDELVISFDDVEIDMNKNVTFVVSLSFSEFDDYGESIAYYVAETTDFNAVEKKNWTRVTVTWDVASGAQAKIYTFNGWKIKLVNKKLWNVDAAQASEDIVVAEWTITITEPLSKLSFTINATNTGVENMKFVVNGEEYEGKRSTATGWYDFKFSNVEIEKSWKIQFLIDVFDLDSVAWTVNFTTFNKDAFDGAKYDNTNKTVSTGDVAGSISFSKVTIQPSRGSLENNITKDVEFLLNETNRKVVFDGTYTAKKGDVYLNTARIITGTAWPSAGNDVTFYLFIDGDEVTDLDAGVEETFSEVLVKAGESVSVKVEAEVEAYGTGETLPTYTLELKWEDVNGNENSWVASDDLVTMKTKESGSTTISAGSSKNTVLLKAKNQTIAEFTVKPSNSSDEDLNLDSIELTFTWGSKTIGSGDIRVKVDWTEYDADTDNGDGVLTYLPNEVLPSDGLIVQVILKDEYKWSLDMTVSEVNGKTQTRKFSKRYEEALVYIEDQKDLDGSTRFYLSVETADSDTVVSNLKLYAWSTWLYTWTEEVVDGDDIEIVNPWTTTLMVDKIEYHYEVDSTNSGTVTIEKSDYNDYFKVGDTYAKIFKVD